MLIGLVLIFGTTWVLWNTRFGLRLRSCGEAPSAAETLGVNVYRYKFVAVLISGAFAGFGGGCWRWCPRSGFQVGQTNGRGYIGLAAMIFGNWRPGRAVPRARRCSATPQALPFREGTVSVHALLLLVAAILVAVAVLQLVRGASAPGGRPLASSPWCFLAWYLLTDVVPRDFTTMAPYVTTLLVLAFASQRLRMPAADGQVYRKGSAG